MAKNPQIDAYIASAAPFAQPILKHLRAVVHEACPAVEERVKWGMPSFEYKGVMCGMAAFKAHCVFGLWKHKLLLEGPENAAKAKAAGILADSRGRITSLKDLPSKRAILDLVKRSAALNEAGVKVPRAVKAKTALVMPKDLAGALRKNKKAATVFADFSYSNKKEYIEWLTDAKTEETRARRLETAIEWIAEGKSRHWKYQRK